MSYLSRYVYAELLKTFCLALSAMTGLTVMLFLGQEGLRQGLGAEAIIKLIPYILPNALCFAVPGTILFSACVTYGRMSADNEIVALKSLGVSPMKVLWPIIVLGAILSLGTLWLSEIAASWGRQGAYRVVLHSVEQTIYSMLSSRNTFSNPHVSIDVVDVIGKRMMNPRVVLQSGGHSPPKTINADYAELTSEPRKGVLAMTLHHGEIDFGNGQTFAFDDEFHSEIRLADLLRKSRDEDSPSNYTLGVIPEQTKNQQDLIQSLERKMALQAAQQLMRGDFSGLTSPNWQHEKLQLDHAKVREFRLKTEPWRRWANACSCLFFVFVGAPLAIRLRNADVWTTFGICFIPILLIYFPLMLLGVDRAKVGAWPAFSVWMGNVVLLLVGLWFVRLVRRY
jgi:lipopolysaccharide export system permease protein